MTDTIGQPGHDPDDPDTPRLGSDVPPSPDVALSTAEAARVAGVSARTVRRWIERGTLPAVAGAGGALYVFPRDLEAARIATRNRPVRVDREKQVASRPGPPRDSGHVRDVRDDRDVSLVPDPAGEAAGAVLVAWRDTVLAPVVEQLANVTRELGDAREAVGRLEAERDAANRERDELRRRVAAFETEQPPPEPTTTEEPQSGLRAWWRRVLGLP